MHPWTAARAQVVLAKRMHIRRVTTPAELDACLHLRRVVFIDEQGVPEHEELDDQDAHCVHFLALPDDNAPLHDAIGTARMMLLPGKAKAQRVAVLAARRRDGVGRALMDALEAEALRCERTVVVLGAQLTAVPFYEQLGYAPEGEVFLDAGIPHRTMKKVLRAQ
jgi:predicted GNAT family N-acyltransferase